METSIPKDFASHRDSYSAALAGMFKGKPEDTENYLTQIFTPDFEMIADGEVFDFTKMIKHMTFLREILPPGGTFETTHFLRDGSQLAERHVSRGQGPEGKIVDAETYQFVDIAEDGRVKKILELVRVYETVEG